MQVDDVTKTVGNLLWKLIMWLKQWAICYASW